MKYSITTLVLTLIAVSAMSAQNADQIVDKMINELGGKKAFYRLKNVTYDVEYKDPNTPMSLSSKETYVFDKERSYATYSEHSMLGSKGNVTEAYDGENVWVKFNGKISNDKQANDIARFWRKTNYYWFAMFFKLQDEGVNLQHIGNKKVEGRDYDLVKVTFGNNIGDAQDTYVLYVNKRTKLVDQLLFTVVAFGITEPELYKFHYETIDGIKIPTERVEISSNWKGEIVGKKWATTYWTNIKFNTTIDMNIFSK
ncbi:hypothetical protein D1818_17695 [Aquimarina sp. BL5]|uniref:DUF6503 family protein n=1 Tax=Aquimarina sp. BL5 TaxID=1714860 RepID=UPI000E4F7C09|nr:DUF6503 family protein [Aquimarina sp. BL5]AXT52576.1 hypothetical protein D1818_17695 [Aquimarina sp. BL5]RKN11238.1 hypothetical protein D7036_01100 [Aquimarina sp. BL5]